MSGFDRVETVILTVCTAVLVGLLLIEVAAIILLARYLLS